MVSIISGSAGSIMDEKPRPQHAKPTRSNSGIFELAIIQVPDEYIKNPMKIVPLLEVILGKQLMTSIIPII